MAQVLQRACRREAEVLMRHKPENPLLKNEWFVSNAPLHKALGLVKRYHYARGGSNTFTALHGLYRRSDFELCGIAWWLPPTRDAAAKHWPNPEAVLSLSRLVVVPDMPTNAASFLLRRSIRLLDARWELLLTYADPSQGHTGAIYKATGWEYDGMSKPERVYFIEDRMVSRKCGPTTRTHQEMLALGARCEGAIAKHRFKMALKPRRKSIIIEECQGSLFQCAEVT